MSFNTDLTDNTDLTGFNYRFKPIFLQPTQKINSICPIFVEFNLAKLFTTSFPTKSFINISAFLLLWNHFLTTSVNDKINAKINLEFVLIEDGLEVGATIKKYYLRTLL